MATRNHRITISLNSDTLTLIAQAYEKMRPGRTAPVAATVAHVLAALLEQWSAAEEMFAGVDDEGEAVELPSDITEQLRQITDPDITLSKHGVTVRHDKTTPKDTDGLVPWEYILAGYLNLSFISNVVENYTNEGEMATQVIRTVLSRIPEDQWESEQTRSIMLKALTQVGVTPTKTGS